MANIRSFPNNQDEYIGAEDVMRWLHGRSSGVFGADGNASVAPVLDAMAITVSDGNGWISNDNADGVVWWIDNEETSGNKLQLEIDMADAVLPRIDRVVVSWQTTNYVALPEVKVLKGTAASKPVAPALTNNNILRQISLASIRIPAGATAITSAMITDERLDGSVCGLVTNGIGVDTSVMQEQFSSLLNSIRQELADLNNDSAALLKAGGTMYGALDMGGNKVQNVADPTDDGDAATKKFVEDIASERLSLELLWQNASPSDDFAATPSGSPISLGDSAAKYTHFMIELVSEGSYIVRKGANCYRPRIDMTVSSSTSTSFVNFFYRSFKVENAGLTVGNCYYMQVTSAGKITQRTVSTSYMKPYRVWGIGGVS